MHTAQALHTQDPGQKIWTYRRCSGQTKKPGFNVTRLHFANDKTKKITLFTSFNPTKQVAHVKNIFYMAGGNGICTNIAHDTFVSNVKKVDLVEHLLL